MSALKHPQKVKDWPSSMSSVYDFLGNIAGANWQYRFGGGTPYMTDFHESGKKESIAGHMWAAALFWSVLKKQMPALSKLVHSETVYEIILMHDLSEVAEGDVSLYEQVQGGHDDKYLREREMLMQLISGLDAETKQTFLSYFDQFDGGGFKHTTDINILIAKLMDALQGTYFCLQFSNNIGEYEPLVNTIMNRNTTPIVRRLIHYLEERDELQARDEVVALITYHLSLFEKAGVRVNLHGLEFSI